MGNRSSGVILIIVGVIVLAVGVTGGELPFPLQLTGDFNDNFNDGVVGGEWTEFSGGNPDPMDQQILEQGGVLVCRTPTPKSWCGLRTTSRYDFAAGGTVSVQVLGQDMTASAVLALGPNVDTNQYTFRLINLLSEDAVVAKKWEAGSGTGVEIGRLSGLASTLQMEVSGSTLTFIADGTEVVTTTIATPDLYAFIWGSSSEGYVGDASFDNFALSVGGAPPGPGTGTLRVECRVDGTLTNPTMGQILISTVGTVQTTSTGVWQGTVDAGYYSASASYNGETKSASGTVSDGGTLTLQLAWTTTTPPGGTDWLEFLQEILRDPLVKALLSMCGVGMIGVGLVLAVAPSAPQKIFVR